MMMTQGYGHRSYAEVFSEFATPRPLVQAGGWILERETPALHHRDAMGCYPLFSCRDWSLLSADIESLRRELVSIALVTDPFGDFRCTGLSEAFDSVVRFKDHYVTDLNEFSEDHLSKQARRNIRKSLAQLQVEVCPEPGHYLDEWTSFYAQLCIDRGIRGIRAFSKESFRRLFEVPGLTMLRASQRDTTVGLHLWMAGDDVAYGHLGATNQLGYDHMASYALYWYAIQHFRQKVNWLDIGAAPGEQDNKDSGLLQFKRRWATGTKPVYLCTRIFDENKYKQIMLAVGAGSSHFFPAYRAGEFE
jgi:hypothetical protein